MAGTPSTSATWKIGRQSAQGTPITTGFITALAEQSSFYVAFDEAQKAAEHGAGAADRATARKSASIRSGYLVRGQFRCNAYPNLAGLLLRGAGFGVSTTGTTERTHVFTLATRANHAWLTMLHAVGGLERRATDARVNRLTLTAQPDGIKWSGEWRALTEDDAVGTETTTAESTAAELLPSQGSLVMNFDPAGADTEIINTSTDDLTRFTMDIANPLDEADLALFRFGHADLTQTGLTVGGTVEGAAIDWATYDLLVRNSEANPSASTAICDLDTTFQSAVNIAGAAVPYSCRIQVPRVEVTIDEGGFTAEGENLIRWSYAWQMIDAVTTPITITLVNLQTAY